MSPAPFYVITFVRSVGSSHLRDIFQKMFVTCVWGDNRSTRRSRFQDYIRMSRYALITVAANCVDICRGHVKLIWFLWYTVCRPMGSLISVFRKATSTPLSMRPLSGTFERTLETHRVGISKPRVPEHNAVLRLPHHVPAEIRRPRWQHDSYAPKGGVKQGRRFYTTPHRT